MRRTIQTNDAPAPVGPYAQAIEMDGWLFVSGQIPVDPKTGEIVRGDIREQVRQVLRNLGAVVHAAGSSFANVVKATVFVTDMDKFADVNAVYSEFFRDHPHARACVEVARLPKDVDVEIDLIAKSRSRQ